MICWTVLPEYNQDPCQTAHMEAVGWLTRAAIEGYSVKQAVYQYTYIMLGMVCFLFSNTPRVGVVMATALPILQ